METRKYLQKSSQWRTENYIGAIPCELNKIFISSPGDLLKFCRNFAHLLQQIELESPNFSFKT